MMFDDDEASEDLLLYPYCMEDEEMGDLLSPEGGREEEEDAALWRAVGVWEGQGLRGSLAEALLPLVRSLPSPTPSLAPWPGYLRYKTELCSRYAETGCCKYAGHCQFAHGLLDLRVPSRHPKYKTELCRSFHTSGYCQYGARCLFVHAPEEQRRRPRTSPCSTPCRTFTSYGVCPFGERCNFIHEEAGSEEEEVTEGREGKVAASPARAWWRAGGSGGRGEGDKRPQSGCHWKPRPALCRTFMSFGFCLYGTRCRFQHSLASSSPPPTPSYGLGLSCAPPPPSRSSSPTSDITLPSSSSSSSSSSARATPDYTRDSLSPLVPRDLLAHNAFSFASQHLGDLLLPLAWSLQQLGSGQPGKSGALDLGDLPL
ncbi:cysteine three histidine 1 [Amia ocellicauda]|uniref:cysteine three histidine 1 n=1 Tax=Amia ocellicauda TaxID=2972642 RepID=UPI003463B74F